MVMMSLQMALMSTFFWDDFTFLHLAPVTKLT